MQGKATHCLQEQDTEHPWLAIGDAANHLSVRQKLGVRDECGFFSTTRSITLPLDQSECISHELVIRHQLHIWVVNPHVSSGRCNQRMRHHAINNDSPGEDTNVHELC